MSMIFLVLFVLIVPLTIVAMCDSVREGYD